MTCTAIGLSSTSNLIDCVFGGWVHMRPLQSSPHRHILRLYVIKQSSIGMQHKTISASAATPRCCKVAMFSVLCTALQWRPHGGRASRRAIWRVHHHAADLCRHNQHQHILVNRAEVPGISEVWQRRSCSCDETGPSMLVVDCRQGVCYMLAHDQTKSQMDARLVVRLAVLPSTERPNDDNEQGIQCIADCGADSISKRMASIKAAVRG